MSLFINTSYPPGLVKSSTKRPRINYNYANNNNNSIHTCATTNTNTNTCSLIINISRREFAAVALATTITAIASGQSKSPSFAETLNNDFDNETDTGEGVAQKYRKLPSGLVVQDLRLGNGPTPPPGSSVRVRWTGRLIDRYGWNFQKEPLEAVYTLEETANLIAGFREGVLGMKLHGKRRLFIPTKLGYRTAKELPQPHDFGDKRRLETSVANKRRTIVDGQGDGGDVLIDVELVKIILPK